MDQASDAGMLLESQEVQLNRKTYTKQVIYHAILNLSHTHALYVYVWAVTHGKQHSVPRKSVKYEREDN